MLQKILHGCLEIGGFSLSVQLDISQVREANKLDIELNTQREISHLQATMYYYFCLQLLYATTGVCVPLRVCGTIMHTHQWTHPCQRYFMPSGVLLGTCASVSRRGLCSLALSCVCSCTCPSACIELALVSLCSLLLSTCAWIPRLCCSTIPDSSIVSGLFPHTLPFFHCLYYISVTGALLPFFPSAQGLMAGLKGLEKAMEAVSSRNWLPIAEAPGYLGHSTSIQRYCC